MDATLEITLEDKTKYMQITSRVQINEASSECAFSFIINNNKSSYSKK